MRNPKKSQRNKIMLAASLLVISMLLSGCGIDWRNYIYTEESLKDVAEKSLEEKYGEEFVVHNAWDKSQEMFFAECSPKDDLEIVFKADIRKNGNGVVSDGYTQGVVARKLDELLEDDLQRVFGECYTKVFPTSYYNVPVFDEPRNVTVKEYVSKVNLDLFGVGYYIFIPTAVCDNNSILEEYDFFTQTIEKMIENEEIPELAIRLYFVDEKMLEDVRIYLSTRTSYDSTFEARMQEYQYVSVAYVDNKINCTYEEYEMKRMEIGINE